MASIFSERLFARFEPELGPSADALGISRDLFHRHDFEYSIDDYFRLLDHAAEHGIPHIGLAVGASVTMADLGPLGYAAGASPTVGHAFALLARYLSVFAHANVVRLHTGNEVAVLSYSHTERYPGLHQQDVELAVGFLRKMVVSLAGEGADPIRVDFAHPRPAYSRRLEDYFGCRAHFDAGDNRLHYRRTTLDLENPESDPSLLEALEFYLAARLKERRIEDDLLEKVKHFISISLGSSGPAIGAVAEILGMSQRTLQRRLADVDVVFSDLVDEVRRTAALDYVRFTDVHLTEIALLLGYSELSAFSRAFRRWTDQSPQQVREAERQGSEA